MESSTITPSVVKSRTVSDTDDNASTPVERMMAALSDPNATFTSDQVTWLMATAARWAREAIEEEPSPLTYAAGHDAGYKARVAEENDDFRKQNETLYFNAGEHTTALERKKLRDRCDAEAGIHRTTDYTGGPVDWDTGRSTNNVTQLRARPTPTTVAGALTSQGSAA